MFDTAFPLLSIGKNSEPLTQRVGTRLPPPAVIGWIPKVFSCYIKGHLFNLPDANDYLWINTIRAEN